MSEVKRYWIHWNDQLYAEDKNGDLVMAADFDRVTAERDALRNEIGQVNGEYDRAVNKVDALQALLTAADELNDVMAGLLRDASSWIKHNSFHGTDAIELWERIDAALKPAGGQLNQCDGCQAGIPVVNGAHRMGKPGAYPDTMSCTAKLYKP